MGAGYYLGLTAIGHETIGKIVDIVLDKSWGNYYENELLKHNTMEKSHE